MTDPKPDPGNTGTDGKDEEVPGEPTTGEEKVREWEAESFPASDAPGNY